MNKQKELKNKELEVCENFIKDFNNIDSQYHLQKRNLTLSDYNALNEIIKDLQQTGKSEFISANIFNYLKKFNMKIQITNTGYKVII